MTVAMDSVSPEALRRELRLLGYQEYDVSGRAGVTWANPMDLDAPAVIVPREVDRDLRGFAETLQSAVERLSWIAEEPVALVVRRLTGVQDRLELRVLHELTERNGIPAQKAPDVVKGFVDLIRNGARTAFNGARADHRGPPGQDYVAALDNIDLLAPEPGSFRLIAVVRDAEQLSVSGISSSRARDALITTAKTLEAFGHESRAAADLDASDVEHLVDAGVSRQLLNAVKELTISRTAGLRLEFSGSLIGSRTLQPTEQQPVVLTDHQVSLARELSSRLVPYEPRPDFALTGWAEAARAQEQSISGFPVGTIVVRARFDGRTRDVLVNLGRDVFSSVKPGISNVHMTGTLERINGRWHLLEPRDISVQTPERSESPPDSPTLDDGG